jgi:hypothetical protein
MVERKTLNLVVVGSIPIEGVFYAEWMKYISKSSLGFYKSLFYEYWSRSSVGRAAV